MSAIAPTGCFYAGFFADPVVPGFGPDIENKSPEVRGPSAKAILAKVVVVGCGLTCGEPLGKPLVVKWAPPMVGGGNRWWQAILAGISAAVGGMVPFGAFAYQNNCLPAGGLFRRAATLLILPFEPDEARNGVMLLGEIHFFFVWPEKTSQIEPEFVGPLINTHQQREAAYRRHVSGHGSVVAPCARFCRTDW